MRSCRSSLRRATTWQDVAMLAIVAVVLVVEAGMFLADVVSL